MKKIRFNDGWTFRRGNAGAAKLFADHDAAAVTLPHDAAICQVRDPDDPNGSGNGYFREENYQYTKEFTIGAEFKDRNIWLEFEGVYQNAFVYVNHSFAGKHPYGYGNFYIDVTKFILFGGKNTIDVIVKNGIPSGRWYTGGGIYRDVNLMIADRLHLLPDMTHLTTERIDPDSGGYAVIRAESTIEYTGTGIRDVALCLQLIDANDHVVAENSMPITVTDSARRSYRLKLYLQNPCVWDTEHPYLYRYRASLIDRAATPGTPALLDEECGRFGIRTLQLDPLHGLRINGCPVKLRGGCFHHDNGVIGTASFYHAEESRVRKLKQAGFNAIRSAHNPICRNLLDACDRLGMLVLDEFSDVWTSTKVDFDYGFSMTEWWETDLTNMVNKDFNHPCVILYSIANQTPEAGNRFDVQWGKRLADKIRALDPSRYITANINLWMCALDRLDEIAASMAVDNSIIQSGNEITEKLHVLMTDMSEGLDRIAAEKTSGAIIEEAAAQLDILGYSYASVRYEMDGELYPNRILLGTETYPTEIDRNWELVQRLPYVLGDFCWTAWDYLGQAGLGKFTYGDHIESKGAHIAYPGKVAYCSDINLIGDRRPISYWREIVWGRRRAPYLSVQPPLHHGKKRNHTRWALTDSVHSWNWSGQEGKPVTVEIYADADEVELLLNGTTLARKAVGSHKKFITYIETIYMPGILEAVAYSGQTEIGRDRIVTADRAVQIDAYADAAAVPADQSDICFIEISLRDADGNLNPEAEKEISVSVTGPGILQGLGSAAPESEENYFDHTAKTYEGRLRAAIRSSGERGTISVFLRAAGCAEKRIEIRSI